MIARSGPTHLELELRRSASIVREGPGQSAICAFAASIAWLRRSLERLLHLPLDCWALGKVIPEARVDGLSIRGGLGQTTVQIVVEDRHLPSVSAPVASNVDQQLAWGQTRGEFNRNLCALVQNKVGLTFTDIGKLGSPGILLPTLSIVLPNCIPVGLSSAA